MTELHCANYTTQDGSTYLYEDESGGVHVGCNEGYDYPPEVACTEGIWIYTTPQQTCLRTDMTESEKFGMYFGIVVSIIIVFLLVVFCCMCRKRKRGYGKLFIDGEEIDMDEYIDVVEGDLSANPTDKAGEMEKNSKKQRILKILKRGLTSVNNKIESGLRRINGSPAQVDLDVGLYESDEHDNDNSSNEENEDGYLIATGHDGRGKKRGKKRGKSSAGISINFSLTNEISMIEKSDYVILKISKDQTVPCFGGSKNLAINMVNDTVSPFIMTYNRMVFDTPNNFTGKVLNNLTEDHFKLNTIILKNLKPCQNITEMIGYDLLNTMQIFVNIEIRLSDYLLKHSLILSNALAPTEQRRMEISTFTQICRQIVNAVRYMHNRKISHRNICLSEIYMEDESGNEAFPFNLRLGGLEYATCDHEKARKYRCLFTGPNKNVFPAIPEFPNNSLRMLECTDLKKLQMVDIYMMGLMFSQISVNKDGGSNEERELCLMLERCLSEKPEKRPTIIEISKVI